MLRKHGRLFAALVVLALTGAEVQAGFIKNLQYAFGAAGFQQQIRRDVFQDGWTYDFAQAFVNKKYDFGNIELTLNGNLQGQFSIGRRGIPEVEFTLSTPPNGLAYQFVAFDGVHKFEVENGFFNINQDIKFNQFGGYDIQLRVSNRGTLVSDGANAAAVPLDFDIGPIDVHGHWVIDLVNLTLGRQFGFRLPGGAADQVVDDLFTIMDLAMNQAVAGYVDQAPASATVEMAAVPEPGSLVLLGFAAAGALSRRGRRRIAGRDS